MKHEKELIQQLITEVRKQYANGELSQNAFNREIDELKKRLKELSNES